VAAKPSQAKPVTTLLARLLQRPPPAVGFGAAKPPREVFLVGFGGFAAKTNQKLGYGAQPRDVASALALPYT
jgi:hypothetical protein